MALPWWIGALDRVDYVAGSLYRLHQAAREELLVTLVAPEDREELTARVYGEQRRYAPGGDVYEQGLFDWERALLDEPSFPRSGRVLVAAAGGGREARALEERGLEVVAFDPCPGPGATVLRASFRDLERATQSGDGPLGAAVRERFDAALVGWGGLSHAVEASERVGLVRALRTVTPNGPVVVSFFMRPPTTDRIGRLRRQFRRMTGSRVPEGLSYRASTGFVHRFSEDEIRSLARTTGHEVVRYAATPFGHAVLDRS